MRPSASLPARDPELWRIARRRAKLKAHLFTFLWVNALLWGIWALTGRPQRPLPWPLWATGFWGIGLAFRAFGVYRGQGRGGRAEREYERLTRPR